MSVEAPKPVDMKGGSEPESLDEAGAKPHLSQGITPHAPSRTSSWWGATSHIVTGACVRTLASHMVPATWRRLVHRA